MTDVPIACTLTTDAMNDRLAFIDALASDALIAREVTPGGLRVRLRDDAGVEARVHELVAAESSCCPFLSFAVENDYGELILRVTGPPEARPVVERLFTAP